MMVKFHKSKVLDTGPELVCGASNPVRVEDNMHKQALARGALRHNPLKKFAN